ARIFEPKPDPTKRKFFITVPWPYTNSSLHVGHGRTYTLADVIARFKRLMGYNVLFPMSFHQSGTPILAFAERLRMGDATTIKQYRDILEEYESPERVEEILESFKEPENIAEYFSRKIVNDFTKLGYSIDWTRTFTSKDQFYQNFVTWQFRKLKELDLIKQGNHPILYSIRDDNAVGEDDIKDGDVDKVTIEDFTAVIFEGKDFSLVAASLRPETIFGVTNLWISSKDEYCLCSLNGRDIVVSKEASQKLALQNENFRILSDISADRIISQDYLVPMREVKVKVYRSTFVDPDNGTGVVYSVPGHAVWDYIALKETGAHEEPVNVITSADRDFPTVENLVKKYGIRSLSDSDRIREATQDLYKAEFYQGVMNDRNGPYSGRSVREARELIKSDLIRMGKAFIMHETSRKAETRSGSKVVVAVLRDQWFIDYSPEWLKTSGHEVVDKMFFYPEFYRKAMHDAIDWLKERPCARRRGIGTKLPFDSRWVIESLSDSTIYPAVYTNARSIEKIFQKLGSVPDDILDYIFTGKSLSKTYVPEIMRLVNEAKGQMEYWYGVDIRLTTSPHLSNHLAFYILNHAAIFPEKYQPKGLIISGLVISNGAKISKSKGNAISLLDITEQHSADLYRLFVVINADVTTVLDWNENDLNTVKKKYDDFVAVMSEDQATEGGNPFIEKWFESSFYRRCQSFIEKMDKYDLRGAYIEAFFEVLNDLKYLVSRGGNLQKAIEGIREIWLAILSPVIPHTCEEFWEKSGKTGFVSAYTLEADFAKKIDESILVKEDYLRKIVQDTREIIRATGINPQRISITTADQTARRIAEALKSSRISEVPHELRFCIVDFNKNRKHISTEINDEMSVLSQNIGYLQQIFGCPVILGEGGIT
ncbi:MAG TPA: leucine--tRNA ligase, partial [Thermoplasmataceae archaeon]|nr:leucine--tRNA ligase [Thermoplasmataceae archaeon]